MENLEEEKPKRKAGRPVGTTREKRSIFTGQAYIDQLAFLKANRYSTLTTMERKQNLKFAKREIRIVKNKRNNKIRSEHQLLFITKGREFNYLKYAHSMMHLAGLKYDITVEDLLISLYLYGYELPINKEFFMSYLRVTGTPKVSVFDRFVRKGYIIKVKRKSVNTKELNEINLYIVSSQMKYICHYFYKRMEGLTTISQTGKKTTEQKQKLHEILSQMDDEFKELRTGIKQPEPIIHEDNLKQKNNL
jgi:hypothetical protein